MKIGVFCYIKPGLCWTNWEIYSQKDMEFPVFRQCYQLGDLALRICNVCVSTPVKHLEEPEEPVRHNVIGNSKRDGAKAERREEDRFCGLAG